MYRKYYYNDTIKFALIPIDEMNKLLNSEDEQDKIAIDTLLRIFPFVIPSNEEIPFIKINGKKYKYTKENFIKSQKEKQNKK